MMKHSKNRLKFCSALGACAALSVLMIGAPASGELLINPYPNQPAAIQNAIESGLEKTKNEEENAEKNVRDVNKSDLKTLSAPAPRVDVPAINVPAGVAPPPPRTIDKIVTDISNAPSDVRDAAQGRVLEPISLLGQGGSNGLSEADKVVVSPVGIRASKVQGKRSSGVEPVQAVVIAPAPDFAPKNLKSFDIDAYYASFQPKSAPKYEAQESVQAASAAADRALKARTVRRVSDVPSVPVAALELFEGSGVPKAKVQSGSLSEPVKTEPLPPVFFPKKGLIPQKTDAQANLDQASFNVSPHGAKPPPTPETIIVREDAQSREALERLEQEVSALRDDLRQSQALAANAKAEQAAEDSAREAKEAENARLAALEEKLGEVEALKLKTASLEADNASLRETLQEVKARKNNNDVRPRSVRSNAEAASSAAKIVPVASSSFVESKALASDVRDVLTPDPQPDLSGAVKGVDQYYERFAKDRRVAESVAAPLNARSSVAQGRSQSQSVAQPQFIAEEFVPQAPQVVSQSVAQAAPQLQYQPAPQETVFLSDRPQRRKWQALKGKSVKDTLAEWSRQAGVEFIWDTGNEFAALSAVELNGTYEGAVEHLLAQYGAQNTRPLANLHIDPQTGQRILVVQASNAL